jgi:hypothetical protein
LAPARGLRVTAVLGAFSLTSNLGCVAVEAPRPPATSTTPTNSCADAWRTREAAFDDALAQGALDVALSKLSSEHARCPIPAPLATRRDAVARELEEDVARAPAELLALATMQLPNVAQLSEPERARVRRFLERAWDAQAGFDALHSLRPLKVGAHALFSANTASGAALLSVEKATFTLTHLITGQAERVTFAPDGQAFIASMIEGSDHRNVYFDASNAAPLELEPWGSVTFSTERPLVATQTASELVIFDLKARKPFASFPCTVRRTPRFTKLGDLVLVDAGRPHSNGPDTGLAIFDLEAREVVACDTKPAGAMSSDGRFIASVIPGPKGGRTFEYELTIHDRQLNRVETNRVPGAENETPDVFFQADGTLIVSSKKPNIMTQQFPPTVRARFAPAPGTPGGLRESPAKTPVLFDPGEVWAALSAPHQGLVKPPLELIPTGVSLYFTIISYAMSADQRTLALFAGETPVSPRGVELLLIDQRTQKLLHRVPLPKLDGEQLRLAFGPSDQVIASNHNGRLAFSVSRLDGSVVALPAVDADSLVFDPDGTWVTDERGSPWVELATGKQLTLPTIEKDRFEAFLAAGRPNDAPAGVICRIGRTVVPLALCTPRYPARAQDERRANLGP